MVATELPERTTQEGGLWNIGFGIVLLSVHTSLKLTCELLAGWLSRRTLKKRLWHCCLFIRLGNQNVDFGMEGVAVVAVVAVVLPALVLMPLRLSPQWMIWWRTRVVT